MLEARLQVMVLPTPNTGLTDPDVFYFGNAVGETGNIVGNTEVARALLPRPDLLVLDEDNGLYGVMVGGEWHVEAGRQVIVGEFEKSGEQQDQ